MTDSDDIDPDLRFGDHVAAPQPLASVVAVVSAGGVIGALLRYQAGRWWPHRAGAMPWTTLLVNVVGCFSIGLVMAVLLTGVGDRHPLARPFLVTGVLGGFTTFSTYAVDLQALMSGGRWTAATVYLLLTVVSALAAVVAGQAIVRRRGTTWATR